MKPIPLTKEQQKELDISDAVLFFGNDSVNEQAQIETFMKLGNQKIRRKPTTKITNEERNLRIRLIAEECDELFKAMHEKNIVEIADALADIIYVVKGAAVTYGINLNRIFNVVQESNLKKFKKGIYKNKDGKIMKPPGWKPPNIEKELISQGADLPSNV